MTDDPSPIDTQPRRDPGGPWAAFRRWPRALRWTAAVAVILVLLLVASLVTAAVLVRRPLPQTSGTVDVAGLQGAVEVVRDEHGIPRLYGDSLEDLLRAQGYVHAQERFYEMDVRRHATAGRLAELFGAPALDQDRFVRTLGWRRVAERELALVSPQTRRALESYAAGVNAWLAERGTTQMAVEYTLLRLTGLDYRPEPWTPVDSLAWLKAMAWDLRGNMTEEIDRALLAGEFGPERAAELYPPYPYQHHDPIVGTGAVVDGAFEPAATEGGTRNPRRPAFDADQRAALEQAARRLDAAPALLGSGDGIGSNSWVVDGEHSATGMPLLANDPHLGTSMPGIWMQMGLHCNQVDADCPLDVAGFTFSGTPGVIIGHNADIAWGFTNLGPDVTDLYLERISGDRWRYDGRWRPLQTRTETIKVRGEDDVEITVRETDHGPLLSDVDAQLGEVGAAMSQRAPDRPGAPYAVALRWTALDPAPTADAILALNTASTFDEFRAAAALFAVPAQNFVYADREGNIAYQAPGRIPIRKSGNDGRMPAAGWLPENDWTPEYVPFDGLPWLLNPEEGFIAAANQAVIGPSYPYFLTDDWDRGYRSQRIRDLLAGRDDLTVAAMERIQFDDANPMGPILVPHLLDLDLPSGYYRAGQRLLAEWDFTQAADSAAAAYFNAVWRNLLDLTFADELPPGRRPDGGQRWFAVVSNLLEDPRNRWWDDVETTERRETRDDMLRAAMRAARDELTRTQSVNPAEWEWGRMHRLDLRNPTIGESGNALAEWLVNRVGHQASGGSSLVNANNWDAEEGYSIVSSPSMRMVVSLGDLDESRWVNLTGVSGHPASAHYDDQIDPWLRGLSLPWAFTRDAVEATAEDRLVLRPAGDG